MTAPITSFQGKYRFLSNFWPVEIKIDGNTYFSVEAAYQAFKCAVVEDRAKFVGLGPVEAKKLGRLVPICKDWDSIKVEVMRDLLGLKFSDRYPGLREMLLATGDAELIEGNTWGDRFWGVCGGKGENHLGKLLMKIRAQIKLDSQEAVEVT